MADFDDVIDEADPYLAIERIEYVAGMTWQWGYLIRDPITGLPIDFSVGYTATCVFNDATGTPTGPTVTTSFPAIGEVWCTVAPSLSAAVTPGTYLHEVVITRVSDGAKAMVAGAGDSKFKVKKVGS